MNSARTLTIAKLQQQNGGRRDKVLPANPREGGAPYFKHHQNYKEGVYLEHFLNVEVQAHYAEDLS